MDAAAFQMERARADRALQRTKTLTLVAIVCALAIPVVIAGSPGMAALAICPLLWLAQLVVGFTAFGIGHRAANAIKALQLPVELAEHGRLRNWSAIGLVVALLGILGAVLAVALGILLISAMGAMGGAWGRPLRIGGRNERARLEGGTRGAEGPAPCVDAIDETSRAALGQMWLHDAIKEHGSVPAFAQLGWELSALGAPAALLARCQRAALQEIDHAQRCFAAVEAYLGEPVYVGAIDAATGGLARGRGGALRCAKRVALETLEDGCLIEDLNADFAARAHALAVDPAMRSLTAIIAREEREHAELAWDILRFCIELDPRVAAAVQRRLARLPDHILVPYSPSTAALIARADEDALAAHGRVPFSEWADLYAARREATIARATEMLDANARAAQSLNIPIQAS
jgi:hypothetical protein